MIVAQSSTKCIVVGTHAILGPVLKQRNLAIGLHVGTSSYEDIVSSFVLF